MSLVNYSVSGVRQQHLEQSISGRWGSHCWTLNRPSSLAVSILFITFIQAQRASHYLLSFLVKVHSTVIVLHRPGAKVTTQTQVILHRFRIFLNMVFRPNRCAAHNRLHLRQTSGCGTAWPADPPTGTPRNGKVTKRRPKTFSAAAIGIATALINSGALASPPPSQQHLIPVVPTTPADRARSMSLAAAPITPSSRPRSFVNLTIDSDFDNIDDHPSPVSPTPANNMADVGYDGIVGFGAQHHPLYQPSISSPMNSPTASSLLTELSEFDIDFPPQEAEEQPASSTPLMFQNLAQHHQEVSHSTRRKVSSISSSRGARTPSVAAARDARDKELAILRTVRSAHVNKLKDSTGLINRLRTRLLVRQANEDVHLKQLAVAQTEAAVNLFRAEKAERRVFGWKAKALTLGFGIFAYVGWVQLHVPEFEYIRTRQRQVFGL